jgi:hypothetical protein
MRFPTHDFKRDGEVTQRRRLKTAAAGSREAGDYFLKLSSLAMKALGPPFT